MSSTPAEKYAPAYEAFLTHGNLARAARDTGVNENSLRSYARDHGWAEDRDRELAERAQAVRYVDGAAARLVAEFYGKPSSRAYQRAREGLDLQAAVGGGRTPEDAALANYTGDRDAYRELLVAAVAGAKRQGRYKEVVQLLELLGELDAHIKAEASGPSLDQPPPDFARLGALGQGGDEEGAA